ncbi:MAG: 16S rRNA (guanine(966)-N(2))-methyltransferase RsmD [Mogibacterium sp.]|nr:16S rRNA (guanine(966)-N(2))-methyltransferase RsmD [Mogibacterium sp.]
MKITSGKYKYRNIEVPRGIRPTTEKVREAVFSMIAPWIPGAMVFDMFAGSGAMGLEALSRGAEHCLFCEASRANQKVLLSNIANCVAGESSTVAGRDFKAAIAAAADMSLGNGEKAMFDIVIMDPPYEQTAYYGEGMELLQEYELLDEGSIVVCEHLYDNKLLESYGNLVKIKEKKYGSIGVDVYEYCKD